MLEPQTGKPRKFRITQAFLALEHFVSLDHEVMRRKAAGEDRDSRGKRFHVNRSLVMREILDVWMESELTVMQLREKLGLDTGELRGPIR